MPSKRRSAPTGDLPLTRRANPEYQADDSEVIDRAACMMRLGAAAFVQTLPGTPGQECFLYGPGFEIRITRTDPDASYPGKPEHTRA